MYIIALKEKNKTFSHRTFIILEVNQGMEMNEHFLIAVLEWFRKHLVFVVFQ